jgi:pyruvate formate lyase activating enzyme
MESVFSHPIPDGRLLCTFCPRRCLLASGDVGNCGALCNSNGLLGRAQSGVTFSIRVAAVEDCGFTRFFPGAAFLVVQSPGSGLESARRDFGQTPNKASWMDPDEVVFLARSWGCKGVVLSTDDPVFGVTEGYEILEKARKLGLGTAITTTGYLLPKGRELLFAHSGAVGLRLFGVCDSFYRRRFDARLQPIQETVDWLSHKRSFLIEVTVPLLAGENDRPADVDRLARWIRETLGPSTPVHFAPGGVQMRPDALSRAAEIARKAGLLDVSTNCADIGTPRYDSFTCSTAKKPSMKRGSALVATPG